MHLRVRVAWYNSRLAHIDEIFKNVLLVAGAGRPHSHNAIDGGAAGHGAGSHFPERNFRRHPPRVQDIHGEKPFVTTKKNR